MDEKRIKEFLSILKDLQFTDILAFGKLLNVEEKEKIEDFVFDIMVAFNEKGRFERRKLLKLAKDVAKENRENKRLLTKEREEELKINDTVRATND